MNIFHIEPQLHRVALLSTENFIDRYSKLMVMDDHNVSFATIDGVVIGAVARNEIVFNITYCFRNKESIQKIIEEVAEKLELKQYTTIGLEPIPFQDSINIIQSQLQRSLQNFQIKLNP
jgi:hypothetical protein